MVDNAMHYFVRRWPFGRRAREHASRSAFNLRRRLTFEPLEDRRMLATITVTSLADNLNSDGVVTLREAIHAAEMNVSVDGSAAGSGADTIQFAPGLNGSVDLSIVGDTAIGPSALLVASKITITTQGNANGIMIQRDASAAEMRLFRVAASGNLTLDSLMLTGGIARGAAGATPGESGGEARGGAVLNEGTLEIIASTLYGNQAIGGNAASGGNGGSGRGGAIYNNDGQTSIVNSTLSSNSALKGAGGAPLASFGGAVYSLNGSLAIHNSTITIGSATAGRGVYIGVLGGTATAEIYSSIIAQSGPPGGPSDFVAAPEIDDQITVTGANNLIRTQALFHEITVSTDDPLLGVLANNGGPTLTHAILSGSPTINQGSDPLNLSTDQRGATYARVVGGAADIGAFELQTATGPELPGDYNLDQVVDTADYLVWRKTFGTEVEMFFGADGNGNTMVDEADYIVWREHFGETLSEAAVVDAAESIAAAVTSHAAAVVLVDDSFASDGALAAQSEAFESLAALQRAQTNDSRNVSNAVRSNDPLRLFRVLPMMADQAQDEALLILLGERTPVAAADDSFADTTVPPTVEAEESSETSLSFRRVPTSGSAR